MLIRIGFNLSYVWGLIPDGGRWLKYWNCKLIFLECAVEEAAHEEEEYTMKNLLQ